MRMPATLQHHGFLLLTSSSSHSWYSFKSLFLDCDTIGNYYDDIEYGYANGGFYTSSEFGGEPGDNIMILVSWHLVQLRDYSTIGHYHCDTLELGGP
jgi:hypothetical protein